MSTKTKSIKNILSLASKGFTMTAPAVQGFLSVDWDEVTCLDRMVQRCPVGETTQAYMRLTVGDGTVRRYGLAQVTKLPGGLVGYKVDPNYFEEVRYTFGISYSDGSHRGPFQSRIEARQCFLEAPIMPGATACLYRIEDDKILDTACGPEEDEEDFEYGEPDTENAAMTEEEFWASHEAAIAHAATDEDVEQRLAALFAEYKA